MRTRAALLIAAFAILVVGASAIVTSHLGGQDWPTPPMPDTATRLITPTEAASSLTDESPAGDDGSSVQRTAHRGGRRHGTLERRPRGERPGRAHGTAQRSGRRSGAHRAGPNRGRGTGAPAPAPQPTPSPPADPDVPDESTPVQVDPAPAAPVAGAGADDSSQARPDAGVPVPAPGDEVIVIVPDAGSDAAPRTGKHGGSTGQGAVEDRVGRLP